MINRPRKSNFFFIIFSTLSLIFLIYGLIFLNSAINTIGNNSKDQVVITTEVINEDSNTVELFAIEQDNRNILEKGLEKFNNFLKAEWLIN